MRGRQLGEREREGGEGGRPQSAIGVGDRWRWVWAHARTGRTTVGGPWHREVGVGGCRSVRGGGGDRSGVVAGWRRTPLPFSARRAHHPRVLASRANCLRAPSSASAAVPPPCVPRRTAPPPGGRRVRGVQRHEWRDASPRGRLSPRARGPHRPSHASAATRPPPSPASVARCRSRRALAGCATAGPCPPWRTPRRARRRRGRARDGAPHRSPRAKAVAARSKTLLGVAARTPSIRRARGSAHALASRSRSLPSRGPCAHAGHPRAQWRAQSAPQARPAWPARAALRALRALRGQLAWAPIPGPSAQPSAQTVVRRRKARRHRRRRRRRRARLLLAPVPVRGVPPRPAGREELAAAREALHRVARAPVPPHRAPPTLQRAPRAPPPRRRALQRRAAMRPS